MKTYEIRHRDGNNEPMIVEAETRGAALYANYASWRDVYSGSFGEYLRRVIYCHRADA